MTVPRRSRIARAAYRWLLIPAVIVATAWIGLRAEKRADEQADLQCAASRASRAELRAGIKGGMRELVDQLVALSSDPAAARPLGDQLMVRIDKRLAGGFDHPPAACVGR